VTILTNEKSFSHVFILHILELHFPLKFIIKFWGYLHLSLNYIFVGNFIITKELKIICALIEYRPLTNMDKICFKYKIPA